MVLIRGGGQREGLAVAREFQALWLRVAEGHGDEVVDLVQCIVGCLHGKCGELGVQCFPAGGQAQQRGLGVLVAGTLGGLVRCFPLFDGLLHALAKGAAFVIGGEVVIRDPFLDVDDGIEVCH